MAKAKQPSKEPSIKVDIHLGERTIPIRSGFSTAKERTPPHTAWDVDEFDDNYPDERKPTDAYPNSRDTPFNLMPKDNVRPATRERKKGNSKDYDIELPDPKKKKKSIASY